MEWNELYKLIINIKVDFDKSYKSRTQNRPIQKNTFKNYHDHRFSVACERLCLLLCSEFLSILWFF